MGLTQEEIKERLAKLKNPRRQNGNSNENMWKPSTEDANIRILQYPYNKEPYQELWFHYRVGKGRSIICPRKMNGKTCPICEFTFELWKTEDDQNKKTLDVQRETLNQDHQDLQTEKMYLELTNFQLENISLKTSKPIKVINAQYQKFVEDLGVGANNKEERLARVDKFLKDPAYREKMEGQGLNFPMSDSDYKKFDQNDPGQERLHLVLVEMLHQNLLNKYRAKNFLRQFPELLNVF